MFFVLLTTPSILLNVPQAYRLLLLKSGANSFTIFTFRLESYVTGAVGDIHFVELEWGIHNQIQNRMVEFVDKRFIRVPSRLCDLKVFNTTVFNGVKDLIASCSMNR